MKNINLFFAFFIIILFGCEPKVVFQDAPPPGIDHINATPSQFQGVFFCESDSSRIYAENSIIYNESYYKFVTTINLVEETENCSIVAGGLYLKGRKECIPFEYLNGDTITAKIYSIDTLFAFRENEVMKLYKGRLFLNFKIEVNKWISFMISPMGDGMMRWEMIDIPDNLKKIKAITQNVELQINEKDETQYLIKPTLIEFEKILDRNYTKPCDILLPLNIENL